MLKDTKRRLCILLCIVALFVFALPAYAGSGITVGGGKEEPTLKPSALEERYGKPNRVNGLTLTLDASEYAEGSVQLTLAIRNKTKHIYLYGYAYYLETRGADGNWYSMPVGDGRYAWPMSENDVSPGEDATQEIDLRTVSFYAVPGPGEYRIAKLVSRNAAGAGDDLLTAEFTVTETKTLYAAEPVYFRTGPGTKYNAAYELQTGQACTALGRSGNWMRVELADGRRGYVFSKYLAENAGLQYYAHPLIAPLGAENIQSISMTDSPKDDSSIQNMGGTLLKGHAEACVRVELKRAYDCYAVRLYLFGNARAAQTAANALRRIHTTAVDAPSYTYYRLENAIVEWRAESRHDFGQKERGYADAVNEAFTEVCGRAIAYLNG